MSFKLGASAVVMLPAVSAIGIAMAATMPDTPQAHATTARPPIVKPVQATTRPAYAPSPMPTSAIPPTSAAEPSVQPTIPPSASNILLINSSPVAVTVSNVECADPLAPDDDTVYGKPVPSPTPGNEFCEVSLVETNNSHAPVFTSPTFQLTASGNIFTDETTDTAQTAIFDYAANLPGVNGGTQNPGAAVTVTALFMTPVGSVPTSVTVGDASSPATVTVSL
jgi:hypothetical protein